MTAVDQAGPGWVARLVPACRGVDPEVFFGLADSPEGAPVLAWEREALSVCVGCPVLVACRAWALGFPAGEQYGVVGGMTAGQRRAALRTSRAGSRLSASGGGAELPAGVDGLVVARLMAGQPVPGARGVEMAYAAVGLYRAGQRPSRIAEGLGVAQRRVCRWLDRHRAGEPLTRGDRPGVGVGVA